MFFDQCGDLGTAAVDRQLVGKVRHGQARAASGDGRARLRVQRLVLGLQRVAPGAEQVAQVARLRAQTALVSGKAVVELGFTRQWTRKRPEGRQFNRFPRRDHAARQSLEHDRI
jgi:hypothetical protein